MFIIIQIFSKNSNSISNFLKFLYKLKTNKILNLNFTIIQAPQLKKSKQFSVLKSPHVNKKAQEQFEYNVFNKQLKIYVSQLSKFLIIWKTVKLTLFTDVNLTLKFIANQNLNNHTTINKINSDKFIKDKQYFKFLGIKQEKNHSLLLWDIYGEFCLKY